MPKQRVAIVDVTGKATHVWRGTDTDTSAPPRFIPTPLGASIGEDTGYYLAVNPEADEAGGARLDAVAAQLGEDPSVLANRVMNSLADYIVASHLSISVPDEYVLADILSAGRFKTNFEDIDEHTKRSEGYLDGRRKHEEEWFGTPANSTDRPIYAAFTDPKADADNVVTNRYGAIQMVLHEDVKDRSTLTIGDSLDSAAGHTLRPFTLDEPNPFVGVRDDCAMELAKARLDGYAPFNSIEYVEAQVHGGVRVEDIALIRIPEWREMSQESIDLIKSHGIKVEYDGEPY